MRLAVVSDLTSRRNLVDLTGITDAGYNCALQKLFWS
jgi:hypothetical protein